MHYEIDGTVEPLLLLHGGTGCHEDWNYAGREEFLQEYSVITPDNRGHGATNNPSSEITHRQCALDTFSLLDALGIRECRAIGFSMGENILLHIATRQPERLEAMILVSATLYFHEQARMIMRQVPSSEEQPAEEWERMRRSHKGGDHQITRLWDWTRGLQDSYDDMNFTPPLMSRVISRTLIVYGDRDPLYPVEMALAMYRAIPGSALCVVPDGGHGPIFGDAAPHFTLTALKFLRSPN